MRHIALGGHQVVTQLVGHEFQRLHVPGLHHDLKQRLGAELGSGVVGIHFAQQRGIGLADGFGQIFGGHGIVEHQIMNQRRQFRNHNGNLLGKLPEASCYPGIWFKGCVNASNAR